MFVELVAALRIIQNYVVPQVKLDTIIQCCTFDGWAPLVTPAPIKSVTENGRKPPKVTVLLIS
jgi:hypothetical protein